VAERLSEEEIRKELASLPEWGRSGEEIRRTVKLPSFQAALDAVVKVGRAAEEMKHHPDIDIRYRTLTFTLTTHDAGGLTLNDVRLAHEIDRIVLI